jgi:hypothetical protein
MLACSTVGVLTASDKLWLHGAVCTSAVHENASPAQCMFHAQDGETALSKAIAGRHTHIVALLKPKRSRCGTCGPLPFRTCLPRLSN